LAAAIAARRDVAELSNAVVRIAATLDPELQAACLKGLFSRFQNTSVNIPLDDAARNTLKSLGASPDPRIRELSLALIVAWQLESDSERRERIATAIREVSDVQSPSERRLAAVGQLGLERDSAGTQALIDGFANGTPQVRDAILGALFARKDRLPAVMSAIESDVIPAAVLSAVQRRELLEHKDRDLRDRAAKLLTANRVTDERNQKRFEAALQMPGDSSRGEAVFRTKCANCHRAHGVGVQVGPDLTAESHRRPETILRDILAPSEAIAAGYATYVVETASGQVFTGVFAIETASSITLRLADGKEQVVLRKEIEQLRSAPVSMMPENLADTLEPQDVADLIAWLSQAAGALPQAEER
jgi:putative heme-binding domain-containing protein